VSLYLLFLIKMLCWLVRRCRRPGGDPKTQNPEKHESSLKIGIQDQAVIDNDQAKDGKIVNCEHQMTTIISRNDHPTGPIYSGPTSQFILWAIRQELNKHRPPRVRNAKHRPPYPQPSDRYSRGTNMTENTRFASDSSTHTCVSLSTTDICAQKKLKAWYTFVRNQRLKTNV